MNTQIPIDAVILWVDGNDPVHQQKMQQFIPTGVNAKSRNFRTRFNQVEEIEYAIKSILKYASFVRNIFLVTDNQVPQFLKKAENKEIANRIQIIDHKVIFKGYEQYLPTFNAMSIESMVHRIPGLAEHFIYFNDDLFLIRDITEEEFFYNGIPIFRGNWRRFDEFIWYKRLRNFGYKLVGKEYKKNKYGYKKGQQNIARELGYDKKYFKFHHTPAAMVKSTIANYFEAHPEMLERNIRHKFRNIEQYTLQGLVSHIHMNKGEAILRTDLQLVYLGSYRKPLLWYLLVLAYANWNTSKLFLCLQSLDLAQTLKLKFIKDWLNQNIGQGKGTGNK